MNHSRRTPLATLALGLSLSLVAHAQSLERGYAQSAHALPPGTSTTLLLADRTTRLSFDGVVLLADDGTTPRTLLSFGSFTFGSFLVQVDGTHVVLGENSHGDLWLVDLVHGGGRVIANLVLNYDAVLWQPGRLLVSAKTGGFAAPDNEVHLVDLQAGTSDLIARFPGASGPLLIDHGGVLYATASAAFPVPPGSVDLLFLRDDQVQGAIGSTWLTVNDARVRFTGIDTAADLALDDDGDVFFVDWLNNRVGEISFDAHLAPRLSTLLDYGAGNESPVALQFVHSARRGVFEPFQPDAPPELFVLETDYLSGATAARGIATLRARIATAPASPIPLGPFVLDVDHAAPLGFAVIAFGLDSGVHETRVPLAGFEQPLLWDADLFGAFESILIPLDAQGAARIHLGNPGVGAIARFVAQAAFVDASGAIIGSSAPITLALQ